VHNESDWKKVWELEKAMGAPTPYLQGEFPGLCPEGWTGCVEEKLLSDEMERFSTWAFGWP
jgi:hypothetical protein